MPEQGNLFGTAPSEPRGNRRLVAHAASRLSGCDGRGQIQAADRYGYLIALRCEPCIRADVQMAHEKGVTQEELIEFLDVAITMQGCPGEEWALKAFAAFKQCANGQASPETVCCTH